MKRFVSIIISLIMLLGATSLIGCSKPCDEHLFGEWTIIESAKDCTKVGIREKECTVCHEKVTEEYYGEHDNRSAWIAESLSHHKVCRKCGESFSDGAHVYENGKCKCGREEANLNFFNIPDFVVEVETGREAKVLMLTDTQIIDSSQVRPDGFLYESLYEPYAPQNMDALCFSYIRRVVNEAKPDLVILCGDNVFGKYDDAGTSFLKLIETMEALDIPWAQAYGNHDNESAKGAKWQNAQLEAAENCLFKKGDTDGNGNYSIAIRQGDEISRMFYVMCSNAVSNAYEPVFNEVVTTYGFTANQTKWLYDKMEALEDAYGKTINTSLCFHIPTSEYILGAKQYLKGTNVFSLDKGSAFVSKFGDFGSWSNTDVEINNPEGYAVPDAYGKTFLQICKKFGVDTTFCGHHHENNTSIMYEGIRWTYVLKTGQYDGHIPGELGGTLLQFSNSNYSIKHIYVA